MTSLNLGNWIKESDLDARDGHEQMDRAYIQFEPNFISLKNEKCFDCIPFGLETRNNEYLIYRTHHKLTIKTYPTKDFESSNCEWTGNLKTNVSYRFTEDCQMTDLNARSPENLYQPIWVAALVILGLFLLEAGLVHVAKKTPTIKNFFTGDDEIIQKSKPKTKKRILSLDTFRGLSLAFMIFVNFGGGDYRNI